MSKTTKKTSTPKRTEAELVEELKKKVKEAKLRLEKLEAELNKAVGAATKVTCRGCGKQHAINTLTYIQTHWYEEPHGCTGGDIWREGEGNWVCPDCDRLNRLIDKPEIEKLKYRFKDIKDSYGR